MPVKFVKLGGQSRPVKFGFNALSEFGELTDRSMDQVNKHLVDPNSLKMRDLLLLCWCALKHGARIEKQEFTATVEDIGDWFDDNPNAMVEVMSEYNKATAPDPDAPVKKNPARKPR